MEIQIRELLEKYNIDSDELITYLQGNGSRYDFETSTLSSSNGFNFIFYNSNHKKYPSRLKLLQYTNKDLTTKEFNNKVKDAIDFLKQSITNVSNMLLFTYQESQICYQYKDYIQIIRAPDDCKKPKTMIGDFPVLVRFKYQGSSDFRINNMRVNKKRKEILMLLKLFIEDDVFWYQGESHNWNLSEDYKDVLFLKKGYRANSPTVEKWEEDYKNQLFNFEEVLGFNPMNNFNFQHERYNKFFKGYFMLGENEKEQFLRAAYWFSNASLVNSISSSSAYQSYITALETFLDKPKITNKCLHCNQNIIEESIGDAFKKLLLTHSSTGDSKYIGILYDLRSKIIHGERVLEKDINNHIFGLRDSILYEDNCLKAIVRVTRQVILTWLGRKVEKKSSMMFLNFKHPSFFNFFDRY